MESTSKADKRTDERGKRIMQPILITLILLTITLLYIAKEVGE